MNIKEVDLKIQKGEKVTTKEFNNLWKFKTQDYFKLSLFVTSNKFGLMFKYYPINKYVRRGLK